MWVFKVLIKDGELWCPGPRDHGNDILPPLVADLRSRSQFQSTLLLIPRGRCRNSCRVWRHAGETADLRVSFVRKFL